MIDHLFCLNLHKRPICIFSVLKHLTYMDLITDFSFQKRTQQCIDRVLPLSERSVCVFHIHHLFILVVQVVWSCRQMSRLQLPDVSKRKEIDQFNTIQQLTSSSSLPSSIFPTCLLV